LVAEHDGLAVGVASYEILSSAQAEIAVLVDDAWQGDGIGLLLIEHLAAVARRSGIRELVGDVLASDVTMLGASASLAPGIARDHGEDPEVVRIHIPTQTDERALAAAGLRDRAAEHNSLRPLLAPASVAVIGVSRSQSRVGYEILQAVLAGGFTRHTYPVNPHAKTIDGLDCYPSVGAIPERVDLAIVAVPASRVEQVIEECAAAHVGAAEFTCRTLRRGRRSATAADLLQWLSVAIHRSSWAGGVCLCTSCRKTRLASRFLRPESRPALRMRRRPREIWAFRSS
jgi:predicted CoA-binding protein/GNAT superfamily N-acetyltransferase